MQLTPRQIVYLVLAVLGLVLTWTFNLRFMQETGGAFDAVAFVKAGYVNTAAASLSGLLWISNDARACGRASSAENRLPSFAS